MSEHFVKYINIDQYKCFNDFSVAGFGRVNLISGKNNVGKTAFMEAMYMNVDSPNAQSFLSSLDLVNSIRSSPDGDYDTADTIEKMKSVSQEVKINSNINSISYRADDSDILRKYIINIGGASKTIPENSIEEVINAAPTKMIAAYIGSLRDSQEEIIDSFKAIQKKDRESDIYKLIQLFDNSIENVKVIGGDSIECRVTKKNGEFTYRNISEFGDGLRHYVSVISDLFVAEDAYLFIDELDNGVHYSSLDQLWEVILNLSKELNVQVFATTHSKETIESYCRVAEKLNEKDISFTTLVRNKEKEVKAIVKGYDAFINSIHSDREVRGW